MDADMENVSILVHCWSQIDRSGYVWTLKNAGFKTVHEIHEGQDVLDQVRLLSPDVLLINADNAERSVFALVDELNRQSPPVRLVILYSDFSERMACGLARCGVQGIVHQLDPLENFLDAVRVVARGCTWFSARVTRKLSNNGNGAGPELTAQDLATLQMLLQGRSNQEIAAELHVAERTLRHRLQKIYDRLQVSTDRQAIAWMIRRGHIG